MSCVAALRELFVWYRVRGEHVAAAASAVRAMQNALIAAWPGLEARLLVRSDDGATRTWMETYALRRGTDSALGVESALAAAVAAGAPALAALIDGERHVEAFQPVDLA